MLNLLYFIFSKSWYHCHSRVVADNVSVIVISVFTLAFFNLVLFSKNPNGVSILYSGRMLSSPIGANILWYPDYLYIGLLKQFILSRCVHIDRIQV